mgnify:CR=1 FL=1
MPRSIEEIVQNVSRNLYPVTEIGFNSINNSVKRVNFEISCKKAIHEVLDIIENSMNDDNYISYDHIRELIKQLKGE